MDYYDEKLSRSGGSMRICMWCLGACIFLFILMSLSGCGSHKALEESESRDSASVSNQAEDSVNIVQLIQIKDSVRLKDSTVIITDSAGNVKQIKEMHWVSEYHYKEDSTYYYKYLFNNAVSELVKERKKSHEVIIEKPLSPWNDLKVKFGGFAMGLCVILALFLVKSMYIRFGKY